MPNKSASRSKRRRGPRRNGTVFSTVVSSVATVSGNVLTSKTFTLAQIIPDVSTGRDVRLHSVQVGFASASATGGQAGGMAQVVLVGEPWVFGQGTLGTYASMPFASLNNSHRTVISVRAPNQFPVAQNRTGAAISLSVYSVLAGSWQLDIRATYSYTADAVVSVLP